MSLSPRLDTAEIKMWLAEQALLEVQTHPKVLKKPLMTPYYYSAALARLMGGSFPQVKVGSEVLVMATNLIVQQWLTLYIRLNNLFQDGGRILIDANLASISHLPVGSIQLYTAIMRLVAANRVGEVTVITEEQRDQLLFIKAYLHNSLLISRRDTRDPLVAAYLQMDPSLRNFAALRPNSPRLNF